MSQIQVNKIYGANGTNAPAFPKGVSKALFPHLLVSPNNVTIAGGYMFLDDGREIATWDGVNYGNEFQMNLKTETNNTGVTSPAANTTYYLYVYLSVVGGPVNTPIGRLVHPAQKGPSGAWIVLATEPENIDGSTYIYVGVLRTDGSANYTNFEAGPETQYALGGSGGLQGSYNGGNTITTAASPGSVVIAGTEALQVTATQGLAVTNALHLGAPGAQMQEIYYDAVTLTDDTTAVASTFTYVAANYEGLIIDYKIKIIGIGARVGRIFVCNLAASSVSLVDSFAETSDVGVSWSAAVNGANIELSYTTTSLGDVRTMRADVKKLRA